jgi:hypothetical protein
MNGDDDSLIFYRRYYHCETSLRRLVRILLLNGENEDVKFLWVEIEIYQIPGISFRVLKLNRKKPQLTKTTHSHSDTQLICTK